MEVKIAVRELIYFVMRSGDIDNTFLSRSRAAEGVTAHKKIQDDYPAGFLKEVCLTTTVKKEDVTFYVDGRCDGFYRKGDELFLDEIKSTKKRIKDISETMNELHWAQLLCYGYMAVTEYKVPTATLQLTYYSLTDEEKTSFQRVAGEEELETFFDDLLSRYLRFAEIMGDYERRKRESMEVLNFPFSEYRPGQRESSLAVYQSLGEGVNLLLQAPTGIGKSMATIFPALHRLREGVIKKIFYLVSRSPQKKNALNTLNVFTQRNMILKILELTGKDKICINDEVSCNPKDCPYARGHFDRVNDCLFDILEHDDYYDREQITLYARLHMVCPHELELDLINFSDVVVGDYNYFFDPKVRLSYFDETGEDYGVLIDEAHGLIPRARDMYSEELSLNDLLFVTEHLREEDVRAKKNCRALTERIREKEALTKEGPVTEKKPIPGLDRLLQRLVLSLEDFLTNASDVDGYERILDVYFKCTGILRLLEYYGSGFRTVYGRKEEFGMELLCMDPSDPIAVQSTGRSHIFFSATLIPEDFHRHMLSKKQKAYFYKVPAPFPRERQKTFRVPGLNLTYRYRERNKWTVARFLDAMAGERGNFLFFFPSYAYMDEVYDCFCKISHRKTLLQTPDMTEKDRLEFLDGFKYTDSVAGFAVMGGVFSEGVDLPGNRLHGVAVVTIGLPGFNYYTAEMKRLFDEEGYPGYDYTYLYPGMIKVAQSGGRLIRTEEDRGVLLLLDHRFLREDCHRLLPDHWEPENVLSPEELQRHMEEFWKEWENEL